MKKTIFVVTTVELRSNAPVRDAPMARDTRTVGFYFDNADALACIENNWGDIHEGMYNYAIIEETVEGLYPDVHMFQWFEWVGDNEEGNYIPCCIPHGQENIRGYGIG